VSFQAISQNTTPTFHTRLIFVFDTSKLLTPWFLIANFLSPLYNQSSFFVRVSVRDVSPLNNQPNEPLQRITCGAR
jgi:hypothetical protein